MKLSILKSTHQPLMDITEFLPDATFVINRQGVVIAWNRAIEVMTGVMKKDILGKGGYAHAIPFYGRPRPMLIDLVLEGSRESMERYDFIEWNDNEIYAEMFLPNAFEKKDAYGWGRASPLYDKEGSLTGAIESIRDITRQKEMEAAILRRERELEEKTRQLEEMNVALKVLLQKRVDDQKEFEESILSNVKLVILPLLEKVKKSHLSESQRTYIEVLESYLFEVLSPFLKNLSAKHSPLTPMEVQVASLVEMGKTTKEIAQLLSIAEKTVSGHRYNLRVKLGLKNDKNSLRSHLLSLK